jgi:Zn-dependent protease
MFGPDFFQRALMAIPIFLFSLTVHEFFHAYTALRFGDSTARDMGRLTLNPLAHLDLFGTLVFFMSGMRFGWAKPVPVNPYNLRNPRVADFWISAAGPLSNMGLAFVFGMVYRITTGDSMGMQQAVLDSFLLYAVVINVSLAFFNLIPIFPLDGSHILKSILPARFEPQLMQFERYAPYLLIFLVIIGGIRVILGPFVMFFVILFSGYG